MLEAGKIPDSRRSSTGCIPASHTRFSWSSPTSDGPIPLGHTNFSWGAHTSDLCPINPDTIKTNDSDSSNVEKAAVKRGFLNKGTQLKDIDPHQLITERLPIVLARAAELHLVEDEEKTPFKSKYEAREILKGVMAQLSSCEVRLRDSDPALSELWSDSVARVDLMLGNNFVEAEELSQGEKHLISALDRMKLHPTRFASEVNRIAQRHPPVTLPARTAELGRIHFILAGSAASTSAKSSAISATGPRRRGARGSLLHQDQQTGRCLGIFLSKRSIPALFTKGARAQTTWENAPLRRIDQPRIHMGLT
jgi:hypothetical protein